MMRRRSLTFALLLVAALSACVDNPRTCPAFDFAAADGWAVGQTGDTIRFSNAKGDTTDLRLDRTYVAGPQPALFDGDSPCDIDAEYRYTRDGVNVLWVVLNERQRSANVPPEDWTLNLKITVVLPPFIDVLDQTYSFALSSLPDPGDGSVYSPSRTIGGVSYIDVVEKAIGPEFTQAPINNPRIPNELAWVRVAYARNVGLVEFQLRDGTVYSRVTQ
jgi:hypothetical protein